MRRGRAIRQSLRRGFWSARDRTSLDEALQLRPQILRRACIDLVNMRTAGRQQLLRDKVACDARHVKRQKNAQSLLGIEPLYMVS